MATVQAALKRGIELTFQIEESELIAEPLPNQDDRKNILFYEAAEGGAGVLTRLASEPDSMAVVASKALEIMHYNIPQGAWHVDELANLEKELQDFGKDILFARLEKLDPAAALAIDRENARRVIRALEVIEITGQPFTANLPREASTRYPDAQQFGLVMDREKLSGRIHERVDRMWEQGFVDEVDRLLEKGITGSRTAQRALGYSQIIAYRQGLMSEQEAREDTKRATRQYARRQEVWFSRDQRITWISPIQPRFEVLLAHLERVKFGQ